VGKGDEDRGGITLTVTAALPCRLDQPVDLGGCQVLSRPAVGAPQASFRTSPFSPFGMCWLDPGFARRPSLSEPATFS
jgi:hypothetical protein